MPTVTVHRKLISTKSGSHRRGGGIRALGLRGLFLALVLTLGLAACKAGPVDPHTGDGPKDEEVQR